MNSRKQRPPKVASFDDGDQQALASPPTDPQAQFNDRVPVRLAGATYTGTRRIGVFTEYDTLKRHRMVLRQAIKTSGSTLAQFLAVIPCLSDWLAGETPLGAQQRFDCACLCDTLHIKIHDAFPDLKIDYHA